MKTIPFLFAAFVLAIAGATQAAGPGYYVNEGYFGKVTASATGSCGFRPVTYSSAWLGTVFNGADEEVGWGIITASGELLFIEESYSRTRYSENIETGVGSDVSYSNVVGPELIAFIRNNSGCAINAIVPEIGSKTKIKWDKKKGLDRVNMNARFSGYEKEVCQNRETQKECRAGKFNGSVTFSGNWSKPR